MEGVADFLDSLVGGVDRVLFAAAIGGIVWTFAILRPWENRDKLDDRLMQATVRLIYLGAVGVAMTQGFALFLKIWLLKSILEAWPFPAFAETIQFQAGMARAALFGALAFFVHTRLRPESFSQSKWQMTAAVAIPAVLAGAWLAHGAGRFDARLQLMLLTVVHQVAAAAWVGGVFQLINLWLLQRSTPLEPNLWPACLKAFATLGIASIALLLATGLPMVLHYIDSWNGFIGTGYGNLLMVKLMLLSIALFLAYVNNRGTEQYFQRGDQTLLFREVPNFIQAEAFVLVSLLFTAVSLSTQPPAVDIPETTASVEEVVAATFKPRIPLITSPTHEELIAGEAGRTAIVGQVPSRAATDWSDYNHNISGIFVATIALMAMFSYLRPRTENAPIWPLGFALLGIFLFFRSDAETWPLGPIGFWESTLGNGEVLQHRIATFLAFMLGVVEYRTRHPINATTRLVYVFPILAAFGGLMLLTHSHVGFQAKTAFLIQAGHTLMGVLAIITAAARWLEIRLHDPKHKRLAGLVSAFAIFQIGMILMFYEEPLY